MGIEPSPPRGRRTLARFVNGLSLLLDGSARAEMGNAPKEVIHKEWNLEVTHLLPEGDARGPRHATPVLFVPPLMVRPYVYDLRPDHSYARTLRDRGFEVYVVDFGVPQANDGHLKLDHYVFTFLPTAVEAALRHAGARDLSLVGYCMGGLFSLLYAAAHLPSQARPSRVRNLVTVGAPINFEKLGVLTLAAQLGRGPIDSVLDRMGNVPSLGAELGFKLMGGPRTVTKWADLALHLDDEAYVRGFDAINTWVNDLLPYPREAFRQLVHEVIAGNKILKRELVLAGRRLDLGLVEAPLLAFAGRTDNIATPASTRDVLGCVGGADKTFVEVPGGHVGVVGGGTARDAVWTPTADWLATRSV